jgi:hypothetical protein
MTIIALVKQEVVMGILEVQVNGVVLHTNAVVLKAKQTRN